MQIPQPILVANQFPLLLDSLLGILNTLSPEQWELASPCPGWTVADIARHLLADDIGILSRRDHYQASNRAQIQLESWQDLVQLIDTQNAAWVETTRRISPPVLCDFLRLSGSQVAAYMASLDPFAQGVSVDWAGPGPAPIWLDQAREFSERWHHQQHICIATQQSSPTLDSLLEPILATFIWAMPHSYRNLEAPENTLIALSITGALAKRWAILRRDAQWHLYEHCTQAADAEVWLDGDIAWQLWTNGLDRQQVWQTSHTAGPAELCKPIFSMLSIIA
jgi:uncharacterized protein (TIGR03083 family)